jgi:hypothetical protein
MVMKKIFMAVGALIAVVVVVVIIAGIIVYIKVDKAFIESQIAKPLNRQVTIEKIEINLLSMISGIEVKNLAISNFKTPEQLQLLQGKPVAAADLFLRTESLRFKVKFLPLLRGQVDLRELVLYSPVINLSKNKQGVLNIDDLIKAKKQPAEQETKEPAKPITADSIPVAIAVGEIGMKNGTINYYDVEYNQTFQIYKLTTLVYDILIDPKELAKKDEMKLKFGMGVKTIGPMKTGSVESFDVTLDASGRIIPFDLKTRELNPEVIIHIGIPDGEISGLQIFNALASIPILGEYLGEYTSFLKRKQAWKSSRETGLDLRYKAPQVALKDGKLELKEARLGFDGVLNLDSKAIDLNLDMVMKKEINDSVKATLAKKIEAAIKSPEVKKYVSSGTLAEVAMKPLVNKDGLIHLKAKVGGTTNKPEVKLTEPQLGSLSSIVKDNAGSLAVEAGKGAAKQLLKGDQQKVLEDVEGLFKKK